MMKPLEDFSSTLKILFTDIDDTLTNDGRLGQEAYSAIWNLHNAGIKVVPVTGRPAGWCEMIARQWPVEGVIGENGGFYFRYHENKMRRLFNSSEKVQIENKLKLDEIKTEVLKKVKGAAVASDQFCRLMDLAIDFCEDIPKLEQSQIDKIVDIFKSHGAQAKVSSIHVNGWFGTYDKVSMTKKFLSEELNLPEVEWKKTCAFVGDSPNDEPMFAFFPISFGVANVSEFSGKMHSLPTYISKSTGGIGFSEIAEKIIQIKKFYKN